MGVMWNSRSRDCSFINCISTIIFLLLLQIINNRLDVYNFYFKRVTFCFFVLNQLGIHPHFLICMSV